MPRPPPRAARTRDPAVDALIARSPDFAKALLGHLRSLVHEAAPDATEAVKWGRPFFLVNGGILCNVAAFRAHCSFGFWPREVNARGASPRR